MPAFDPSSFLDATTDQALDTRMPPCPAGKWIFECIDVKARNNPKAESEPTAGHAPLILDFIWESRDSNLNAAADRDKVQTRLSVFVTLVGNTIETGDGKNTRLGALRAGVGQNVTGQPWNPRMVKGQTAKLTITHRPDKADPTIIYDNITTIEPPYGE